MRIVLNVMRPVFADFWLLLGWMRAGVIMRILITTIPSGLQAFKIGLFSLWPFGREIVETNEII